MERHNDKINSYYNFLNN